MPKQLTKMNLDEISLVDEPASPDANILLAKSKKGNAFMNLADLFQKFGFKKAMSLTEAKRASELQESVWALHTSLNSILADEQLDDAGKATKVNESISQFLDLIKSPATEGDDMSKTEMTAEEKAKAYDEMKAKEAEAVKKAAEGQQAEDVLKAKTATLEAENAELKKKLGDVIEKQEAETRLAKAKELTASLPSVKAEDMANVLKGMTAEQIAALEGITKTLGEQVKAGGLFKSIGQGGGKSDAQTQLDAKAAEIAKAENVSIQKAFTLAAERNPDLYEKARAAAQ